MLAERRFRGAPSIVHARSSITRAVCLTTTGMGCRGRRREGTEDKGGTLAQQGGVTRAAAVKVAIYLVTEVLTGGVMTIEFLHRQGC